MRPLIWATQLTKLLRPRGLLCMSYWPRVADSLDGDDGAEAARLQSFAIDGIRCSQALSIVVERELGLLKPQGGEDFPSSPFLAKDLISSAPLGGSVSAARCQALPWSRSTFGSASTRRRRDLVACRLELLGSPARRYRPCVKDPSMCLVTMWS